MERVNRRAFFKRTLAAGVAGGAILATSHQPVAAARPEGCVGTLIDLTLCDGCAAQAMPSCVAACRQENAHRYPHVEGPIQPYWPRTTYEDWSDKQNLTNRLTPYNWTYVQKVTVEHEGSQRDVFLPRRCMHCDNPPCAKVCPFAAQTKQPEGPVVIDEGLCFGGAKCRDVCPWGIPARQAGVGLYLKVAPQFAGGGVMYKCDLCYSRVRQGRTPACVEACPRGAILYGSKDELRAEARRRAEAVGGEVYGDRENGGTSTFYVSAVPFAAIDRALREQAVDGKPGRPAMPPRVGNFLDTANGLAAALLVAPVAGLVAAGAAALRTMRVGDEE